MFSVELLAIEFKMNNAQDLAIQIGRGFVLCEYEFSTFRIERVIKNQASFFMIRNFDFFVAKIEFLLNIKNRKFWLDLSFPST